MQNILTDLPFKLNNTGIVIVKGLPVIQCNSCREYLLADAVMAKVDDILKCIEKSVEFEVVRFAA